MDLALEHMYLIQVKRKLKQIDQHPLSCQVVQVGIHSPTVVKQKKDGERRKIRYFLNKPREKFHRH